MRDYKSKNKYVKISGIFLYIIIPILNLIIILFAIYLDLIYHGKLLNNCDFYSYIDKFCNRLGISYMSAFYILSNNVGIFITFMDIVITLSIELSSKYNQKIYGLCRADIYNWKNEIFLTIARIVIYLSPIYIIFFINIKFCVTGYILFVVNHIFLSLYIKRLNDIYKYAYTNIEKIAKLLCDNIHLKEIKYDDFFTYENNLKKLKQWFYKYKNWEVAEEILFSMIKITPKNPLLKRFYFCYYKYINLIFSQENNEPNLALLNFTKNYVMYLFVSNPDNSNTQTTMVKDSVFLNDYITLTLFESIFKTSNAKMLIGFLEWFLDYQKQTNYICTKTGQNINPDLYSKLKLFLLINLEEYLHKTYEINSKLNPIILQLWQETSYLLRSQEINEIIDNYILTNEEFYIYNNTLKTSLYLLQNDTKYKDTSSRICFWIAEMENSYE